MSSLSRWAGTCLSPSNHHARSHPNARSRPAKQVPGEVRGTLDRANYMLSIAEKSLKDVALTDTDKPGFRRYIKRDPLGVVLVIAPWKCVPFPDSSSSDPYLTLSFSYILATRTSSWSTPCSRHSSPAMSSSSNHLRRLPSPRSVSRSRSTTPASPRTRCRLSI